MFTLTVKYTKQNGNRITLTFKAMFPQDDHGGCTPCFSLTVDGQERTTRGRLVSEWGGTASVAEVQKHALDLEDIRALHLADADGAPTHAEANAIYWAAGATIGHMGEKYHGSLRDGVSSRSPNDCIQYLSQHLRIDFMTACNLINHVEMVRREGPTLYECQKDVIRRFVAAQRPRWAREATACVAKHYAANGGADGHL